MTFSANLSRLRILASSGSVSCPHDVGDPEADDDVGDALVLEALDAVEGEARRRR